MQLDDLIGGALGKSLVQLLPILALALGILFLTTLVPRDRRKRPRARRAGNGAPPTKAQFEYQRRLDGVAGELKVRRLIEQRYAHSLHDIYLPCRNGTTQIDHVILVRDRIVVVETKNYSGIVFANPQDRNWTQVLAGGNIRLPFLNPIRQNALHVNAVKLVAGGSVEVINLVAFVGSATFARALPEGVMELVEFASFLDSHRGDPGTDPAAKEAWARLCRTAIARPRSEAIEAHRKTLGRRLSKDRIAS